MSVRTSVEVRDGGPVARITIHNAAKLNILTRETLQALAREVRSIDPEVRAVVLAGEGERAFIGGADLDTLGSLQPDNGPGTANSAREFIGLIHAACAAIRDCPVPVIARIQGWCLGAGLEIAAACDLRVAAEDARFGMPEVRLGIPSVVEAALLPRLVGAGRARWLVMTGEPIGAAEAFVWGLVEKLAPVAHLDAALDQTLDAVLAGSDESIRAQKRLCKLWEEAPLAESIRASIDEFAESYAIDEPRNRVAAFRAARKK